MSPTWLAVARTACIDDFRWRMRRARTAVAAFAALAFGATLGLLPLQHLSLMVVDGARAWPDSTVLALGSASMGVLLASLSGFYLVRGRLRDELQCGIGGVIAATPARSSALLAGRWLGSAGTLMGLAGLSTLATALAQAALGETPVQAAPYLGTTLLMMGPTVTLASACAVLCDAWAPLMGKRGDLLFFVVWIAQIGVMPVLVEHPGPQLSRLAVLDVTGVATVAWRLEQRLGTTSISIGVDSFDATRPAVHLPADFWRADMVAARLAVSLLALLPLALAGVVFHRFSPDRVRPAASGAAGAGWIRWPLRALEALGRPLGTRVGAAWQRLARVPGLPAEAAADALLALRCQPAALALLPLSWLLQGLVPASGQGAIVGLAALIWALLLSEMSPRDGQSGTGALGAVLPGGLPRQALRQMLAGVALGAIVLAPTALRWAPTFPHALGALASGVAMFAALATLAGRLTGQGRGFLVLYLLAMYAASQAPGVAALDTLGFNHAATPGTISAQCAIALAAAAATWLHAAAGPGSRPWIRARR